ncbi:MAG: hypothetical protein IJA32_05070 [Lachnospiraceae bacterium]|nr:hypothetical protein [Lachnospiraceae bacterium]
MSNETKDFLYLVKLAFPVFEKKEKRFFLDFTSSVNDYALSFPNCTKESLISYFGEPKDIVITYFNNMDSSVYFTIMKRTRRIKQIFTLSIISLLIMLITTFCFWISAKNSYDNATIDNVEITITESISE